MNEDLRPPEDRSLREPEDAIEGWRLWFVRREAVVRLYSGNGFLWTPRRTAVAACPYGCASLGIPGPACQCGFHAFKELDSLADDLRGPADGPKWVRVVGRMAGWGRVMEGEAGWRCSKAYPAELWLPYSGFDLEESLGLAYRVPVGLRSFTTREE